jgi:uncharacterized membrane protein YjjP (DUF1212 family)
VHNLVDDVVDGRLAPAAAMRRLEQVRSARHPYRGWVVTAAQAVLAAAIVVLLGGGPLVAAAGLVATVVVDRTNRRLEARHVPVFFQNAVGGFLATAAALALVAADVGVRRRGWSSPAASSCCCPARPSSAPCRTPSPATS